MFTAIMFVSQGEAVTRRSRDVEKHRMIHHLRWLRRQWLSSGASSVATNKTTKFL